MTQLQARWTSLTIGVLLSLACSVQAQTYNVGQQPVISPWFGLYQRNGGPLDNYHTFVRPQIELNDALLRQQNAIQYNSAGLNTLGRDVNQLQDPRAVRPTGTASGFMNYSHYFPTRTTGIQAMQPSIPHRGTRPPLPAPGHATL